jgi:hypothetical protein
MTWFVTTAVRACCYAKFTRHIALVDLYGCVRRKLRAYSWRID